MNNTTLAKHQWLYEQGAEPDYFVYELTIMQDQSKDGWSWKEVKANVLVKASDCEPTDKPYFTETHLWELLGTTLTTFPLYHGDDLHEVLLNQTIYCVKNRSLKAEGKE